MKASFETLGEAKDKIPEDSLPQEELAHALTFSWHAEQPLVYQILNILLL